MRSWVGSFTAASVIVLVILGALAPGAAGAERARWRGEASGNTAELGAERTQVMPGSDGSQVPRGGGGSVAPRCDDLTLIDDVEHTYQVDISQCAGSGWQGTTGFEITIPPSEVTEPDVEPLVVTAEDVEHLIVAPGRLSVQPDRGWVLVNIDTIVWTEAADQSFSVDLLGESVSVSMTPVDYTWDFGDGSAPLTTTHPGAPWPNHSVAHTYTRSVDSAQVTLTTRWAGTFEVGGSGVVQPVQGLATTTEASAPFEVRSTKIALVTDPAQS